MTEPNALDELATKLAWEEYKLLQDKLDKLGDFRFRVKTWAVTISSGLIAGGAVGKVSVLACLLALIVLVMFWSIEQYYNRVHSAVVLRLRAVERHLVRMQRRYKRRFRIAFPGLVVEIEKAFRRRAWFRRHAHSLFYAMFGALLLVSQIALPASTKGERASATDKAAEHQLCAPQGPVESGRVEPKIVPTTEATPRKADAAP